AHTHTHTQQTHQLLLNSLQLPSKLLLMLSLRSAQLRLRGSSLRLQLRGAGSIPKRSILDVSLSPETLRLQLQASLVQLSLVLLSDLPFLRLRVSPQLVLKELSLFLRLCAFLLQGGSLTLQAGSLPSELRLSLLRGL